jgi:transcriptional regulator with GAF, ATPase, and Fis domain
MSGERAERATRSASGELMTAYARAQGMLLSDQDATAAVQRLALVARDLVVSSVGAGASLLDENGRRVSAGTTDKVAAQADVLQYDLGEGPCLSAWATASVQHVHDTATEGRWQRWCAAVQQLGVRSVVSAPMVFKARRVGALKIYSTRADAFGVEDEHRLLLLAEAAGTLLGAAQGPDAAQQLTAGLQAALADRQAVEAATGVLMERHRVDHGAARSQLIETSRLHGVPMAQLAREILTGAAAQRS